jgi:hypothetical protein
MYIPKTVIVVVETRHADLRFICDIEFGKNVPFSLLG